MTGSVREFRINPIVPNESVPARGLRPRKAEDKAERDSREHVETCSRTTIPTSFELGSGLFLSTLSPEAAA